MERPIMARLHTRITPKQKKFLEAKAKRDDRTEGAILRFMIDYYMEHNKK